MSNLINTILAIALAVVLAAAAIFYGGSMYTDRIATVHALTLVNQAQQIHGASLLYYNDTGEWPANTAVLAAGGYLNSPILPPAGAYALKDNLIPSALADNLGDAPGTVSAGLTAEQLSAQLVALEQSGSITTVEKDKLLRAPLDEQERAKLVQLMTEPQETGAPSTLDWTWVSDTAPYIWLPDKLSEASCAAVNRNAGVHPSGIPANPDPSLVVQCFGTTSYTLLYLRQANEPSSTFDVCQALQAAGKPCADAVTPEEPTVTIPDTVACTLSPSTWSDPVPSQHVVALTGLDAAKVDVINLTYFYSLLQEQLGPYYAEWNPSVNTVTADVDGTPATVNFNWDAPYNNEMWISGLPAKSLGPHLLNLHLPNGTTCTSVLNYVTELFSVTGVTPGATSALGGELMTLTGTGFEAGLTGRVYLPTSDTVDVPLTVVDMHTATFIAPTSPSLGLAYAHAILPTGGSQGASFSYTSPYPLQVTSVSPSTVYFKGGTVVAVTGAHLDHASTVNVYRAGTYAVTPTTVAEDNLIVTLPAVDSPGAGSIYAANEWGESGSAALTFESVQASAVSPASGVKAGGYPVTVTGRHFANGMTFTVGGVAVPYTLNSDTSLTFTMPNVTTGYTISSSTGAITISITRDAYTATQSFLVSDYFLFTSLSPSSGSYEGGYTVSILGNGFTPSTTVGLGSSSSCTSATPITATYVSSTQLTYTAPAVTKPTGPSVTSTTSKRICVTEGGVTKYQTFSYNKTLTGTWLQMTFQPGTGFTNVQLKKTCDADADYVAAYNAAVASGIERATYGTIVRETNTDAGVVEDSLDVGKLPTNFFTELPTRAYKFCADLRTLFGSSYGTSYGLTYGVQNKVNSFTTDSVTNERIESQWPKGLLTGPEFTLANSNIGTETIAGTSYGVKLSSVNYLGSTISKTLSYMDYTYSIQGVSTTVSSGQMRWVARNSRIQALAAAPTKLSYTSRVFYDNISTNSVPGHEVSIQEAGFTFYTQKPADAYQIGVVWAWPGCFAPAASAGTYTYDAAYDSGMPAGVYASGFTTGGVVTCVADILLERGSGGLDVDWTADEQNGYVAFGNMQETTWGRATLPNVINITSTPSTAATAF